MNSIQLTNTLPDVFKGRTDIASDVWLKDLTFEKGKSYLIEANSGTGKSSLFSFLYGYRNDYQGQMIFDGHDINHLTIQQWTEIRRNHLSLLWQKKSQQLTIGLNNWGLLKKKIRWLVKCHLGNNSVLR